MADINDYTRILHDPVERNEFIYDQPPRSPTIYLYPTSGTARNRIQRTYQFGSQTYTINQIVANAIENGLEQLASSGAIHGYEVYLYDQNIDIDISNPDDLRWTGSCGGDPADPCEEGEGWDKLDELRGQLETALEDDVGYTDLRGCHYPVTEVCYHAGGPYADHSASNTAWVTPRWMFMGLKHLTTDRSELQDEDKVRSFAIQEPLHTYISNDVVDEEGLVDQSDTYNADHQLGKVYSSSDDGETGSVSPMATLWAAHDDSAAYYGRCSSDTDHDGGNSQQLTSCTKEGVRLTAEAAYNS